MLAKPILNLLGLVFYFYSPYLEKEQMNFFEFGIVDNWEAEVANFTMQYWWGILKFGQVSLQECCCWSMGNWSRRRRS